MTPLARHDWRGGESIASLLDLLTDIRICEPKARDMSPYRSKNLVYLRGDSLWVVGNVEDEDEKVNQSQRAQNIGRKGTRLFQNRHIELSNIKTPIVRA